MSIFARGFVIAVLVGATAAVLLGASPATAAQPPVGWTSSAEGDAQVWRFGSGSRSVEFRLHAPESGGGDLSAWFRKRSARPPDGTTMKPFGPPTLDSRKGVVTLIGEGRQGGTPVIVSTFGCEVRDGRKVYGELLSSVDMTFFKARMPEAIGLLADACSPGAVAAQAQGAPGAPGAAASKTTAAPGQRLQQSQIEAVLYSWEQVYRVTGLRVDENQYLLLKDGSYYDGLPSMATEDFDVRASRAAKPKAWGRWKKDTHGDYLLLPTGSRSYWAPPGQLVRSPARAGERLAGTFTASSGVRMGTTVSREQWKVGFGRDGRFWQSSNGSIVGNQAPGMPDAAVHVQTTHDDHGSVTSVSGPNVGGGVTRGKPGSSDADRAGTYRLDGYTLELHYDSGRVERTMFYTDTKRNSVWFNGRDMMREKRD